MVTEIVNESNLVKRMKIMKHFIKVASKFGFRFRKALNYIGNLCMPFDILFTIITKTFECSWLM